MTDQAIHLHQGKFLSLSSVNGWEFCHRHGVTGVAVIVATTSDNELLLVEQYRPPVDANVLELPAGLVGDEVQFDGEDVVTAAGRELEEETGYQPGQIEPVMYGPTSAGMSSEIITILRATQCHRVGPGGGVDGENIIVHPIALDAVDGWLASRHEAGQLIDPKVFAGLWWALTKG